MFKPPFTTLPIYLTFSSFWGGLLVSRHKSTSLKIVYHADMLQSSTESFSCSDDRCFVSANLCNHLWSTKKRSVFHDLERMERIIRIGLIWQRKSFYKLSGFHSPSTVTLHDRTDHHLPKCLWGLFSLQCGAKKKSCLSDLVTLVVKKMIGKLKLYCCVLKA